VSFKKFNVVQYCSKWFNIVLESSIQTESECATLWVVSVINTCSHLWIITRVLGDGEEVTCCEIEAQARATELLGDVLRQSVADLEVLEAEIAAIFNETSRVLGVGR
jgi:hypothetical protein